MTTFALQSLRVAIDGGEEDGLLILFRGVLVGVLVCLDDPNYANDQGQWHLEASFGKCATRPLTFPKLEGALRWAAGRLDVDPGEGAACAQTYMNGPDGEAIY